LISGTNLHKILGFCPVVVIVIKYCEMQEHNCTTNPDSEQKTISFCRRLAMEIIVDQDQRQKAYDESTLQMKEEQS